MPKKKPRKKYPKLPSGFGTIRFLGSGRRNCYAIHPPAAIDALGHVQRPAAICYTDDWIKGFTVLTAYKAGTYKPGMERELAVNPSGDADILVQRIISDYSTIKGVEERHPEIHEPTFKEVYDNFWKWKFEDPKKKKLSKSCQDSTDAAFKNCADLHDLTFRNISVDALQENLDKCTLKHASLELIMSLYRQMYKYAIMRDICEINRASYVAIKTEDDDEHGVPFTDDEMKVLWSNKEDDEVQMILIMCYSGFRITECKLLEVNLEGRYFFGGMKTEAGTDRTVPIHPAIFEFVQNRILKYGELIPCSVVTYRTRRFYPTLERLNIRYPLDHTPHDTRHTFSKLAERYHVSENDRKRMMGHSFGKDVTNGIYGHRDLSDLRKEIEKITIDEFVTNCD